MGNAASVRVSGAELDAAAEARVRRSRRRMLATSAVVGVALLVVLLTRGGDDGPRRPPAAATPTVAQPPPPARPPRLTVGIGEQRAPMFGDPRFQALGVTKARLVTAYDTVAVQFERELVDLWLAEARRVGVEPFITFGHSRVNPDRLPTVDEFRAAFRAFRARYPDVRLYAAWNEINHSSQPTHRSPARAAAYFNVVRAECPSCTVVAGDVLDQPGMMRYVERYRRHLAGEPAIWGLHNYNDVNRFDDRGLRALIDAVPGEIWLTETGGLVKLSRSPTREGELRGGLPFDVGRAARATAYALGLARGSERVTRIYLYNWTGSPPDERFDSGLIAPDGTARPAYDVLLASLRAG